MRSERWFLAFWIVLFAAVAVDAACLEQRSVFDEYQNSSAVFSGTVVTIEGFDGNNRVVFEALQTWKGESFVSDNMIEIWAPDADMIDVGYDFAENESYLVYSYLDGPVLWANACGRTKLLADAVNDTTLLNGIVQNNDIVCTQDAMECPDGSFVGRDPANNCEFFSCPAVPGCKSEGEMCGGIAGFACCSGLTCDLEGDYPDAAGTCVAILACVDQCGDGTCNEVVCQGPGCPCAETATSCPADCVAPSGDSGGKWWQSTLGIVLIIVLIFVAWKIAKMVFWVLAALAILALIWFMFLR